MSLLDSSIADSSTPAQSRSLLLLGVLAALLITGVVFAGYSVLRRKHQQRALAEAQAARQVEPRGPAKAQIRVDEPLLKGGQRILGGSVRNISGENLSNLVVDLELTRRKDGGSEKIAVQVEPTQLAPQQEGRYSLQLRATDYVTVKLAGLRSGANPTMLAYVAGPGQKRPAETLESKTIIVDRPGTGSKGGFLNSPDNPGRVP